jgi:drug/metabolite transporter (DMT)-like permease
MVAAVLALVASLCYGTGDVLAGNQARRTTLWTVLVFSQLAGLVVMALVLMARGRALPQEALLPALGAGLLVVVSTAAYYQALAIGVMGIVAPIGGLGAAVPVIVGLASGERPSAPQLAGIGIALGGVVLASRAKSAGEHHQATSRASILFAVLAALAWGFIMVLFAQGAQSDPYWTVALSRATSVTVFVLAFVVMRPELRLTRAAALPILAVGLCEAGGFTLFSVASTLGYLSVVSVLTSVYPVFVVTLAYIFLHERLSRTQQAGVASAIAGVALIAAG